MTTIKKSAIVPYTPAELYALVDDIPRYPQFLPWCKGATVYARNEDEVRATIEVSRGNLQQSFTTCNRLQRDKMIELRLVEGPFKRLEGFWRFEKLGEAACKVSLDLEFEFSTKLLDWAIGPVFSQIANSLLDAFCKRAVEIYGKR